MACVVRHCLHVPDHHAADKTEISPVIHNPHLVPKPQTIFSCKSEAAKESRLPRAKQHAVTHLASTFRP
eukprot:1885376-Pleurochrysis_carterae.AAC.1